PVCQEEARGRTSLGVRMTIGLNVLYMFRPDRMQERCAMVRVMRELDIWAVVPVKDTASAKQRLAPAAPAAFRRALALAMLEDVLEALAGARGLAGRLLVTTDPDAIRLAARYEAQCIDDGAADGHTGAVTAAGLRLLREGRSGMLTLPGDIPL